MSKSKIKMTTSLGTPEASYIRGREYELTPELAQSFIKGGVAIAIDSPSAEQKAAAFLKADISETHTPSETPVAPEAPKAKRKRSK